MSQTQPHGNLKLAMIAYAKRTPLIWDRNVVCTKKEREDAWTAFADGFNLPVEEVRKRWEGIRRMYCHELKSVLSRGSHSEWVYFLKLDSFLRGPIGNILLKEGSISASMLPSTEFIDLSSDDDSVPCSPHAGLGEAAVSSSGEVIETAIPADSVPVSPKVEQDLANCIVEQSKENRDSLSANQSADDTPSNTTGPTVTVTNPSVPAPETPASQPESRITSEPENVWERMEALVKSHLGKEDGRGSSSSLSGNSTNSARNTTFQNRLKKIVGPVRPKPKNTGRLPSYSGSETQPPGSAKARLAAKCGEMIPLKKRTNPAPDKKVGARWLIVNGKKKLLLPSEKEDSTKKILATRVQPHSLSTLSSAPQISKATLVYPHKETAENTHNRERVQNSESIPVPSAHDESKIQDVLKKALVNQVQHQNPPTLNSPQNSKITTAGSKVERGKDAHNLARVLNAESRPVSSASDEPKSGSFAQRNPLPENEIVVAVKEEGQSSSTDNIRTSVLENQCVSAAVQERLPEENHRTLRRENVQIPQIEESSAPRPVPEDKDEQELPSSTKPATKGLEWILPEIDEWRSQNMDRPDSAAETDSQVDLEARKNFLLSFLPDMSEMSVEQRRFFKSKLMYLICNIDQFS